MDDNAKTILRQILAELQGTLTVSAPAGGATEAKQDTIIGHVDGIETLIGSTNTKLDTVNTNLTTIDGRVDGIETLLTAIDGHVDGIEGASGWHFDC